LAEATRRSALNMPAYAMGMSRPDVNALCFSAPEPPPARLAWAVKDERRIKKLGPRKPEANATGLSTEQFRRNKGRPRNQCPPDPVVMDQVMGIRSSQRFSFDDQQSNARAMATRISAGKTVGPKNLDQATGLARTLGTRMYGRTRGELPIEPEEGSAGIKSVTLSDQRGVPRQPDTTTSKKKLAQYAAGTHAHTVGAVIRSATAVSNHVSETAGTASCFGSRARSIRSCLGSKPTARATTSAAVTSTIATSWTQQARELVAAHNFPGPPPWKHP